MGNKNAEHHSLHSKGRWIFLWLSLLGRNSSLNIFKFGYSNFQYITVCKIYLSITMSSTLIHIQMGMFGIARFFLSQHTHHNCCECYNSISHKLSSSEVQFARKSYRWYISYFNPCRIIDVEISNFIYRTKIRCGKVENNYLNVEMILLFPIYDVVHLDFTLIIVEWPE